MTRAIMVLQQEHKSMSKLFHLMRHLSDEIDGGESPDSRLLQEIGEYLSGYPELCHHPIEDLIFRRLRNRAPNALKPGVDLSREHDQLSELIESFMVSLQGLGSDADIKGTGLAATMRGLVDAYEHHMEMEETHFFPASVSVLTADDWAEVDYATSEQDDPLFDEATTKYAKIRDEIFRLAKEHDDLSARERQTTASELLAVNSVSDLNAMMKARGLSLEMKKNKGGGYVLVDAKQSILMIPECREERASWCAYCFIQGRYFG